MRDETDLDDVLGIKETASSEEIRRAFRDAAKRHHPDRFNSYVQKVRATARMQALNNAYSVLRDPALREDHDRRRRRRQPDVRRQAPVNMSTPIQAESPVVKTWRFWAGVAAWLTVSATYAAWSWQSEGSQTGARLVMLVIVSLIVTPVIIGVVVLALSVPAMAIGIGFREGFESGGSPRSVGAARLVVDVLVRVGGLTCCAWLLAKLYQWDVQFDLLYLGILAIGGGLAGEVAAAILYVIRGQPVARSTTELVRETG